MPKSRHAFRTGRIAARIFAALILMLVAAAPDRAHACSCLRSTVEEHLGFADVVFVGELVRVGRPWWSPARWTAGWYSGKATARVDLLFKGDVGRRVEIGYHRNEGTCGIDLIEGSRGVILLREDYGRFSTDLCLFDLEMDVDAIVEVLGEGRSP